MKGLKEFVKAKKLNEDKITVIHTKNGKVDYIEKGEMVGGRLIRDAGVDFKDFVGMDPEEAKNALVKFSRFDPKNIIIEGCKKVQEDATIYPADLKTGDIFHMYKDQHDKKYNSYKVDKVDNNFVYSKSINPNGSDMKLSKTRDYKVYLSEGCKKVQEAGNIKMHRNIDNVDVIIEPDGSYTFWKDNGKTKGAQNRSLHGQQGAVKELGALGYEVVKEATSNLREGFGELEVYTSFGPGFGVQIYPSRNGELTAHVGYVGNGSGNGTRKKELKTETEMAAQDQIKVSDLKQIEKVLKKHLDALDSDLDKTLKQLGYK